MRNIEDDVLSLWGLLWNKGMIGSLEKTDKSGRKQVRYFINEYGTQIFNVLVERYKLSQVDGIEKFLEDEKGKVLIICPFCGAKTTHGMTKCEKCGAEL
jgi:hypothetical protein